MRFRTGAGVTTVGLLCACLVISLAAVVAGCGSASSNTLLRPAPKPPPRAALRRIGLEFFTEFASPHWRDVYRLFPLPVRRAGSANGLEGDHQALVRRHLHRATRIWVVGSTVYVRAGKPYEHSIEFALKVARREHDWKIVIFQVTYRHLDGSSESSRINAS